MIDTLWATLRDVAVAANRRLCRATDFTPGERSGNVAEAATPGP